MGDRALGHYTHEKSSVGCAAALATIDCLFEDGLIENSARLGQKGLQYLSDLKAQYPSIHEARGLGLFFGIELREYSKPASQLADKMMYHSLSNGLSYKVGGGCVLTLCPPLTITEQELFCAFEIIEQGLQEISN